MKNYKNYTRTQVTAMINEYLLECTPSIDELKNEYDLIAISDKDRVNYAYADFQRGANYPYNLKQFPNEQMRLSDYLQGLPGMLSVYYTNYDILQFAVKTGAIPENYTDKQADKILDNWWSFIACKFLQLHTKINK